MEADTLQDDEPQLTQLADFWWFEHLLAMPGVTEEVISHFGQMFPYREVEHAALPAPVSARMFLRHIRTTGAAVTDWKELLEVLGLLHMLSCKQHQFRAPTTAAAISPPSELLVEVLMQVLVSRTDAANAINHPGERKKPLKPLAAAAQVADEAEGYLSEADLGHMQGDELLQNRVSLLEQLLVAFDGAELARQLEKAFPPEPVEESLREYVAAALVALGKTTLEVHQDYQGSGRPLPPDPLQFFAAMAPEPTQAAMDAAAATAGGGAAGGGPSSHMPLLQPQQLRGAAGGVGAPLSLLGEATAPFVGSEQQQAEGAPGSAGAKQAAGARGRQQQQQVPAAASPGGVRPSSSPKRAADADAAAGGGRKTRSGKEVKVKQEPAGGRASRKQLQLEPTNTAGGKEADAATASEEPEGAAAAAGGAGGRRGRRSRKQQQEQDEAENIAATAPAAVAAAPAPAGGRKRGRKAASPPAAAAANGSEQQQQSDSQANGVDGGAEPAAATAAPRSGSKSAPAAGQAGADAGAAGGSSSGRKTPAEQQHATSEGGAAAAADAAAAAKSGGGRSGGRSIAGAFREAIAATAAGLAAAVRGSPSATAAPAAAAQSNRDKKLCGAPQEGVKGRAVLWESPFGGSVDSPEESKGQKPKAAAAGGGKADKRPPAAAAAPIPPPHPASAAAAAAAAGGPISKALKRKRAQAEAAGAAGVGQRDNSGNTEYQDAQEGDGGGEDGGDSAGANNNRGRGRKQKHKQRQRGGGGEEEEDEYVVGVSSEEEAGRDDGYDSSVDEPSDDFEDYDGSRAALQRAKQKKKRQQQQQQRRPASAGAGGGGGGGYGGGGGGDSGGPKRRRKVVRWSEEEEELLIQLTSQHGEGQWALIHRLGGDGFHAVRTQVDLKDKWRNLRKKGAI